MVHTREPSHSWLSLPESDRRSWTSFRRAAVEILAALDADLREHADICFADFDAMITLYAAHGVAIRMADLARAVSRSPSTLTRLVARLEKRGLVARSRPTATEVAVTLTDEGYELLARVAPRHLAHVDALFWSRLPMAERDQLGELCSRLLDSEQTRPSSPR
jgi:DNA-binding MarR family transcriptional regulator